MLQDSLSSSEQTIDEEKIRTKNISFFIIV